MKKMLSIILLVAMVLTMVASVASAASNPFGSKMITCAANAEVPLNHNLGDKKLKNAGRLYVRHYLYGEWGGTYTNYFKASIGADKPLYGGNWMAPDTANFVRSNSLITGKYINAWGRGNTSYGLNRIEITGYSDPDA